MHRGAIARRRIISRFRVLGSRARVRAAGLDQSSTWVSPRKPDDDAARGPEADSASLSGSNGGGDNSGGDDAYTFGVCLLDVLGRTEEAPLAAAPAAAAQAQVHGVARRRRGAGGARRDGRDGPADADGGARAAVVAVQSAVAVAVAVRRGGEAGAVRVAGQAPEEVSRHVPRLRAERARHHAHARVPFRRRGQERPVRDRRAGRLEDGRAGRGVEHGAEGQDGRRRGRT